MSPRQFRIDDATRVRWQWFYHGRTKTPQNQYFFIEHLVEGNRVTVSTDLDWAPTNFNPSPNAAAVELLGTW